MQKPFVKVSPKKNLQFFGFTFEKNYYENTNIQRKILFKHKCINGKKCHCCVPGNHSCSSFASTLGKSSAYV